MDNKLPLVSVIIPTYNRANLVTRAIDSALNQTYKNIEIIVVDDGSKDSTKAALAAYGANIRYFYKENGGESSARNYGIRQAKGEYLAFLDSDDQWLPSKLEKQMQKLLESPDFGLALTDFEVVDEKGRSHTSKLRKSIIRNGYILPYILKNPGLGCSSTLITKKAVFDKVGDFDKSFYTAADQDWIFRACSEFKTLLVDEILVKMEISIDSLSKGLFTKNRIRVLRKIGQYNPDFCQRNKKLITKAIAHINLGYAEDLLWNRYIKEAQGQILESMRNHFSLRASFLYVKSGIMQVLSFFFVKYKDKSSFSER